MGVRCLSVCLFLIGWLISLSACLVVLGGGGVLGGGVVCFGLRVRKCPHYERQVSRVQVWVGVAVCVCLTGWLEFAPC